MATKRKRSLTPFGARERSRNRSASIRVDPSNPGRSEVWLHRDLTGRYFPKYGSGTTLYTKSFSTATAAVAAIRKDFDVGRRDGRLVWK